MFEDGGSAAGGSGADTSGWLPGASPLLTEPAAALACAYRGLACSGIPASLVDARQAYLDVTALGNVIEAWRLHTIRVMDAHEDEAGGLFRPGSVTARWLTENATLTAGRARALVDVARAGDPEADAATGRGGKGALPVMAAALAEGLLTREHLEIAVRALTHLPTGMVREHAEAIDALLTEHAKVLPPTDASQLAAALIATLAPKNVEDYADRAQERRWLRVRTDATGMVRVEGQLDPVGGALFKTLIEHLASIARAAAAETAAGQGLEDQGAAGEGNGGGDAGLPETLTPEQYLADAAVDLARYAQLGLGVEHPHAEPARVTVTLTPEQMTHPHAEHPHAQPEAEAKGSTEPAAAPQAKADAEPRTDLSADQPSATEDDATADVDEAADVDAADVEAQEAGDEGCGGDSDVESSHGQAPVPAWCRAPGPATCEATGVLSTQATQTLICDAVIDRVVITREGQVLSLTTLGRLATRAQRRALAARDGGCTFPGCPAKATWADAHHIVWWSRGGPTTLDNLCLLCQHHHSEIHREHWTIVLINGVPWFRPPPWIDPAQQLRRNTRHRSLTQTITAAHRLNAGEPITDLLTDIGPWQTRNDTAA